MDKSFEIKDQELAGFDIAGWKQPSGVIKLDGGKQRFIKEWPKEIKFNGNTFVLEEVQDGRVNEKTGEMWQNALYA